jgi:hypothetical protein
VEVKITSNKTQNKNKTFGIGLIIIIASAALVGFLVMNTAQANDGAETTDLVNDNTVPIIDNNGNTIGTATASAIVWQTLYVTPKSSYGDPYWVSPEQPYQLLSLYGKNHNHIWEQIDRLQNAIYMQITSDIEVTGWTFNCKEYMYVLNSNDEKIATVVDGMTVNANGQSAPLDSNIAITSAGLTATQMETILAGVNVANEDGMCKLVIVLTDITLTLNSNEATVTLTSAGGADAQNVLTWIIYVA